MDKNPGARLLPLVIGPAIMPALLLPMMANRHLPDYVQGGTMGVFLGLSIGGLFWMVRRNGRCAPSRIGD